MRSTLSVALITLNEQSNLPRTLASVAWADQIVVVDCHSTDRTRELAAAAGAQVYTEDWKGFAAQKNSALAKCACDWTLSLDADEELSPALAAEIQTLLESAPAADAYWLPRLNFFLGRALRHGGQYPDRKLRLFRRGQARFSDRAVHETLACAGSTGVLRNPLLHHAYPTLTSYVEHMNRYSSLGAEMLAAQGRSSRSLPAFLWNVVAAPMANFIYNYGFRLGFLDGREGLLMHMYHCVYTSWKYAKAWRRGVSGASE